MQSGAPDRGFARPVLCTSLCTNGGQRVDDVGNPGGNEEVQGITLCFSKYLLTRDYARSLLVFVPESARRPGGEDRASARLASPARSSGIGTRTVFTATSDRAVGLLREVGGNDESANVTGNRGERRVRPGRHHLRVVAETETCWIVRRARGNPQPASGAARQPGTLDAFGRTSVRNGAPGRQRSRGRSRRNWGHPNWSQRGRFLAPGPRARATGSA